MLHQKWNVTTLIRLESNFSFFGASYCSCLGLNALLALPTYILLIFWNYKSNQFWVGIESLANFTIILVKVQSEIALSSQIRYKLPNLATLLNTPPRVMRKGLELFCLFLCFLSNCDGVTKGKITISSNLNLTNYSLTKHFRIVKQIWATVAINFNLNKSNIFSWLLIQKHKNYFLLL